MHYAINTEVLFPANDRRAEVKFKTVSSFRIESGWKNLTDTAEVVLAKKLFFDDAAKVFELIKTGDAIVIRGGYNATFFDEFTGFVSAILDDMPVVLKCEDNMYKLKRTPVEYSKNNITLETLLKAIVPSQFKINAMDVNIGKVFFSKTTVAQVLTTLKDDLGIYSYFVGDTLVSGKIYSDNPSTEVVKYQLEGTGKNVIKNDLKYYNKDDNPVQVEMVSYLNDGRKISVTVGDKAGAHDKLICSNVTNKDDIKKLAEKELARLRFDGYKGGLTGFCIPYVRHGYTATLSDSINANKGGDYYVDEVITSLNDMGAYRRVVKIGPKAAEQAKLTISN